MAGDAEGSLAPLDGARVLACGMVLVGHVSVFVTWYMTIETHLRHFVDPHAHPATSWQRWNPLVSPIDFALDVFFVLSGFFACRSILRRTARGVGVLRQLGLRLARLYPLLLLHLVVLLLGKGPGFVPLRGWLAALLFHANYISQMDNPATIVWSLAADMHFYVLLLLLLRFRVVRRRLSTWLAALFAVFAAVRVALVVALTDLYGGGLSMRWMNSFFVRCHASDADVESLSALMGPPPPLQPSDAPLMRQCAEASMFRFELFYSPTHMRLCAFLAGALTFAAVNAAPAASRRKHTSATLMWCCTALVLSFAVHLQPLWPFAAPDSAPVLWALVRPVFVAALAYLLYYALTHPECLPARALSRPLFGSLAPLVYSTYLFHPFLMPGVFAAVGAPSLAGPLDSSVFIPLVLVRFAALLVAQFALSSLLHRFVEMPALVAIRARLQ